MLSKKILFLISLAFIFIAMQSVSAVENITECGTVSSSGQYELNASIEGTATCLTITSGDVELDCKGYTLSYGSDGVNGRIGINVVNGINTITNITVKNCIINDINALGTTGHGISFSRVSNSYIFNNTIQTNATTTSYGIYFVTTSNSNIIENNSINAFGSGVSNHGIYFLYDSNNNIIRGNTITTYGTTPNYGIWITSLSENNLIENNTITTGGSGASNYATYISFNSDNNTIRANTITTSGTTTNHAVVLSTSCDRNTIEDNSITATGAVTSSNYGVYLTLDSNYNTIQRNTVNAYGSSASYALYLFTDSNDNLVSNNNLSTYSTITASAGHTVYVFSSKRNDIINNNISSNGVGTNYAVYLTTNANNNTIANNTIASKGTATANYGVYVISSRLNLIDNNTITTYGTNTNNGIMVTGSYDSEITNNNIVTSGATGTGNLGISLATSLGFNIENNVIVTGGTSGNIGMSIATSLGFNIENNNITTGTTSGNIGMSIATSSDFNITNNNLVTGSSSTGNSGIALTSSASFINIENNNISVLGTGTSDGITLATSNYVNIKNNTIATNGTTGATNRGIVLTTSIYNNVDNNYITTWGTTANAGIFLTTVSNENFIRNNTILARGTGTTNYGFYATQSQFNEISGNSFSTNGGGTTNYGIHLITQANRNTFTNNIISTMGTTSNHGVYIFTASYNTFIGNNITANGTTKGVASSNYGVYMITTSNENQIYNNTITTDGGGTDCGVYILTDSNRNIIQGNTISAGGDFSLNYGVFISAAYRNVIKDNIISTSGTLNDWGVYIYSRSEGNIIKNNTISTIGTTSHAFYLLWVAAGYPYNNIFDSNQLLSISGNDLHIATASIDGTQLINQPINTYYFTGVGSRVIVENSSAGKINFLQPLVGLTQTDFSGRVYVQENFVFIDSTVSGVNKSAEITLYNIPTTSTELQIYRNGIVCDSSICANLTSLQAGNVTFNVTGGGSYSILALTSLPSIELNLPGDYFNTSSQDISFNFTATDDSMGDLNCSIYIDSSLNQTNSTTQNITLTNFLVEGIAEGNHSWYIGCFDSAGNRNVSATRTFNIIISQPSKQFNYPTPDLYIDNTDSVLLNYSVFDNDLRNMTVWLYGDDVLLNTSENIVNGTPLVYNWQGLSLGEHNWSVKTGNSIKNSSLDYQYFNLINLTINCEAGGSYRQNALVLVQGNVSDGISALSSQSINASLYKEDLFNISRSLTSLSDGSFQTTFSSLGNGNYTLNTSITYQGINKSCVDNFTVGGELTATSASFVLDKIISLQELNPTNVTYNITLRTTNKGGSSASSINLTDADSTEGSYDLGTLTTGNSTSISYTKTYQRNSTNYNITLAIASVNGTDSLSETEISANSSEITLIIPATTANTSLTLTKNAQYLEENTTSVTYNLSVEIINSGGIDLASISINDSDISLNTIINLNRTQTYSTSNTTTITKTSTSQTYTFAKANATYDSTTYQSNQISVLIPALENNASLTLSKIASVYNSTNINITYNISLILTNIGGRNATLTNITDSDSTEPLYEIGTLTAGQTETRSYLKTYNKSSIDSNQELAIATSNGIDYLDNALISALSNSLSVFIPALETNASLLLSKLASVHLTNATSIVYNITLSLTNKGGRNATSAFIYDSNYTSSSYDLGNLTAGQTETRSYLQTFSRETYLTNQTLSIATANATDLISNNLIEANSSEIIITIPARTSAASFVLDKIASFHNLTNESFIYNITLRLTNKGGSNATEVNITDLDYGSNLDIGVLSSEETITRSYLLNFTRNSTTYYNTTSIAQAYGIDSSSSSMIYANSSLINLTIPSRETGKQITIVKSISSNNWTSSDVNYTVSIDVVNSGGVDLNGIAVSDDDLNLSTTVNLNRTQSYSNSGYLIITREQTNSEETLSTARAFVDSTWYYSNIIKIIIPGYGNGPNDLTVDAPASMAVSTAFSTSITIANMNPDIGQDFTIDYWITNLAETTNYSIGSATLFVAADGGSNSTSVNFNSPSIVGTYKFMAKVRESGKDASDSFEVVASSSDSETPSGGTSGGGSITGKVTEEIICPIPYMRYGKECCLDANNNTLCDRDEVLNLEGENKTETEKGEVEETPKKESQFLNNIKGVIGNIGRFFSSIVKNSSQNKNYLFRGFRILIVLMGIIFLIRKITKRKLKETNRLKKIIGKEVYAESGDKIGKVTEVYLENYKIYGWLIKPDRKIAKKIRKKKILIKHNYVKSIGKIMIIEGKIAEHLDKLGVEGI